MQDGFEIDDSFLAPLFGEIFVVKERDFSIEYNPMGVGRQKLLMLVNSKTTEFLETEELKLLQTIVEKGLRKTMEDVWVVNFENFPDKNLSPLIGHFEPSHIIVWGLDSWMGSQGINVQIHKSTLFEGVEILQALPLSQYITEPAQKPKLWLAMQKLFFN
jgi:hypothetical protein